MKYDSSMTQFHSDIIAAIKSMISPGKEEAKKLVYDASPVPLREFVKRYGKTYFHGENFECIPNALFVCFDHEINDNGDTKLQLSWSQVAKFIRDNASEIFDNPEESHAEEKASSPGIEVLDLDLRTYNALKRAGINTIADAEMLTGESTCAVQSPKAYREAVEAVKAYRNLSAPDQTETAAPTAKYAEAVQLNAQIMTSARAAQQNLYDMAMGFKKMRDDKLYKELGYDNFGDYCEGETGMTRRNVYKYISVVENLPPDFVNPGSQIGIKKLSLLATIDEEHRTEIIENTDLESTTVKELREQIEQLKQSEAETQSKLETSQRNYRDIHDENQKLRADRVIALTRADNAERNVEKFERQASELSEQVTDLERQIKEMESRPRDVAVDTNELNRRVTEVSIKLQKQAAEQVAEERRDFADKLNRMEEERDRLESRIAELESGAGNSKEKDMEIADLKEQLDRLSNKPIKIFAVKLTLDDFEELIRIVKNSGNATVSMAIQKAQILRI